MTHPPQRKLLKAWLYACLLLMLLCGALMHFYGLPKITSVSARSLTMPSEDRVNLPHFSNLKGAYLYMIDIDYARHQSPSYWLNAKGCIQGIWINTRPYPIDTNANCGFKRDYLLKLLSYLHEGSNKIVIVTGEPGLAMGARVFNITDLYLSDILGAYLFELAVISLFLIIFLLTGELGSGILIAIGFILALIRFIHTSFMAFSMDMPGHLKYISAIANTNIIPAPQDDYIFYHPPIYYSLYALTLKLANYLGSFDATSLIRSGDLLCFAAFWIFGALTLKNLIKTRPIYYTMLALLVFYPIGISIASRIDSNLLFYALYAASAYYFLLWLQSRHTANFALALLLFGIGLATRSNIIILAPVFALMFIWSWIHEKALPVNLRSASLWISIIVILAGGMINFGRSIYYHNIADPNKFLLISNTGRLDPQLGIKNNFENFIFLNWEYFQSSPFWSAWSDQQGRQYFWNSFFKSSLFGEFEWQNSHTAFILADLLLVLSVLAITLFPYGKRYGSSPQIHSYLGLLILFPVIGLMMNRILFPYACSQDFRYVYPALIAFCAVLGITLDSLFKNRHHFLAISCFGMVATFIFYSLWFNLSQNNYDSETGTIRSEICCTSS